MKKAPSKETVQQDSLRGGAETYNGASRSPKKKSRHYLPPEKWVISSRKKNQITSQPQFSSGAQGSAAFLMKAKYLKKLKDPRLNREDRYKLKNKLINWGGKRGPHPLTLLPRTRSVHPRHHERITKKALANASEVYKGKS